jgi:hypothetical protein
MLPRERSRADHRVIARILQLSYGIVKPEESTLDLISKLYSNRGGSWVSFFEGNPKHCSLLKRVTKAVVKHEKEQYE